MSNLRQTITASIALLSSALVHAAPLEPQTASFIDAVESSGGAPIYTLTPQDARNVLRGVQQGLPANPAVAFEDTSFPTGPSGNLSVRIYRPINSNTRLPVIVYFHGGGWILGDRDTHQRLAEDLVAGTGAALVFVNYTPSPEARYPVAIEEAYAATRYVAEHGESLNLDGSRLAVAGDSVGGNMAIAVTLLSKERQTPSIQHQVLFYPVTDAAMNNVSYETFQNGPWLTRPAMQWFWDAYLPDVNRRKEITASPLQASVEQLQGLPEVLVITAENDVLRDEGEGYAFKLSQAGVKVTAFRSLNTIHDFLLLNPLKDTPATQNALQQAIQTLKTALNL